MSKQYEKDDLGKRMKVYENCFKPFLPMGTIKVIRLDMRAGHTFCKHFKRPFDDIFSEAMTKTTIALCEEIPGVKFAYTQSDEISLALNDNYGKDDRFSCFFEGNLEKIVSISASIATAKFNMFYYKAVMTKYWDKLELGKRYNISEFTANKDTEEYYYIKNLFKAQFDSRVFILPTEMELHNYFLWRQQDATRNSILSVGYANFSQSKMDNKNCEQIQNMLHMKGINWNDFPIKYKRGILIVREEYTKKTTYLDKNKETQSVECTRHRWTDEFPIPILSQAPDFVSYLYNTNSINAESFYKCSRNIELNKWLNTETNKIFYGITIDSNLYQYALNSKDSTSTDRAGELDITNTELGQKIIAINNKNIANITISLSTYNNKNISLHLRREKDIENGMIYTVISAYDDIPIEVIFTGELNYIRFKKYIDNESKVVCMLSPDKVFKRL